jgi:hypothetical protein
LRVSDRRQKTHHGGTEGTETHGEKPEEEKLKKYQERKMRNDAYVVCFVG